MTDMKTSFGDKIVSDLTNAARTLRRVVIVPRDTDARVSIEFDLLTGEYRLVLETVPMNRHRARDLSNALGGIITWADTESWPASHDHSMRLARDRMELDELQAQGANA